MGLLLSFSACKKKDEPITPTTTSLIINGFSPTSGVMGTVVIITGTNFSTTPNRNKVKFNGKQAEVTAATATQLTVTVPQGAGDGAITVEGGGKIATSSDAFDYLVITVSTLAGSDYGYADGTGKAAMFNFPSGVTFDGLGNVYVADQGNHRIRKVTPAGEVTTLAGSGIFGYADGTSSTASFRRPSGVAVDASGNLYVADAYNSSIRKINPAGEVTTIAGRFADGTGTSTRLNEPNSVACDDFGNVYVADLGNHRISKVTPAGEVITLAGSIIGYTDGAGSTSKFKYPQGVAVDGSGHLYVADWANNCIRKITPAGVVTTLAGSIEAEGYADGMGSATRFDGPSGVAVDDSGNLYVADTHNQRIRRVTPTGEVTTIAGSTEGYADGTGKAAKFAFPRGVAIDGSGNLYVADTQNHRIRKITIR